MQTTQQDRSYLLPPMTPLSFLIEIGLIVILGIIVTLPFADMTPTKRLVGNEAEYLMSSQYTITTVYHQQGYIPLWQPWMEVGEPLVNNPFSFVLNPISSWPSFIYGTYNGVKISIILSVIFAGLGGWVLGRILGFHALARVLLALLVLGKGNMHAILSPGFFQLSTSQAYFPWITAGVIGIFWYKQRRWPIVLTALMFTLMFWSGLLWYALPTLLVIGVFLILHLFYIRRDIVDPNQPPRPDIAVDWQAVRRLILAGALTVGLCAMTLLPMWNNRNRLGQTSVTVDYQADVKLVADQYFSGQTAPYWDTFQTGNLFMFYSYVVPDWFAELLIGAFLICVILFRAKLQPARLWLILLGALFIIVFCTYWGAGQNPIIEWAYTNIPLVSQFRYVSRVLAVSSFWIAIVAALFLEVAWRRLVIDGPWKNWKKYPLLQRRTGNAFAIVLVLTSGFAAQSVLSKFNILNNGGLQQEDTSEDACVRWLRNRYPTQELSAFTVNYRNVTTYLRYDVRHFRVATDFYHIQPEPSQIFPQDLTHTLPEFAVVMDNDDKNWVNGLGYVPLVESPSPANNNIPCVYHKDGALPYAYSAPRTTLASYPPQTDLKLSDVTPITTLVRSYDQIGLIVNESPNDSTIVTLQEVDYPGWIVTVDGSPAQVVSVGGQIGVVLPAGTASHRIYFQYKPADLYRGAALTLFTWLFCLLYLLNIDRFIPVAWRQSIQNWKFVGATRLWNKATGFLLDPHAFEPPDVKRLRAEQAQAAQLPPLEQPKMLPEGKTEEGEPGNE